MAMSQKNRNAYKRLWRNMRNYDKAVEQLAKYDAQADRSLELARKALLDMCNLDRSELVDA